MLASQPMNPEKTRKSETRKCAPNSTAFHGGTGQESRAIGAV